ncbi:MAG: HIT family protein [Bacteroidetes bacterium HGW-Bacteroidetes-14]|jgi:histidine triad (HIT) family protein|nr:MAG: HIT family protein [Bacteroidetes bacterium HGW-Bacteroidetes-14]
MSSIFSKIARGEIPSYKIAESDKFYAFLDINPLSVGHTLVIPKEETDYIFDLGEEDYSALFLFANKVAKGIEKAIPCARIGVAVIGLEVPHAHIHLIPINDESDMDFRKPKLKLQKEEMEAIAARISSHIKL